MRAAMGRKFHVTPEGPKPCSATKRPALEVTQPSCRSLRASQDSASEKIAWVRGASGGGRQL